MPECRQEEEDFYFFIAFKLYDYTPAKEPLEIFNFGRTFHGYHYFILSLSDRFHEMTDMATP